MGTRLLFIVNPRGSRAGEGTTRARTVLEAAGVELVAPPCPAQTEALRELIRARAPALDGVVLGGGDGTLHAALPALLACERPLGVLPLGTANDFARSIGLPLDPAAAAAAIAAGARRRVDVGFVDDRPYLNTASVGLAAALRGDLTRANKQRLGALAYPLAALRRWRQSLPFSARVRAADGTLHLLRTRQLSVANGPSQGGGTVDPENAADDGLLALHAVEARGLGALLLAHLALRLRRPSVAPGLLALRGRSFEVHTDRPLEVSADGEHVGRTPVRFTIRPAALEVFVLRAAQPASTAGTESSGWRHDEAVVALNGLVAALAETARAGEEAAARLAEDEPLATLLAALAQRRRAHAELLAVDVRELGALPRAEDPDLSALASLWSRARSLVADDPGASELAARAGAERALATRAREALAAALPEPVARRIAAIARECEASADGLERLGHSSRRAPP